MPPPPPPPPANPFPGSPPPPDVDPDLTDPESSSPGRGPEPDPPAPTISPTILARLKPTPREIYRLVFAAGGMGMTAKDLSRASGLTTTVCSAQMRSLEKLGLLKEVPDVRCHAKKRPKLYMAFEFKPSDEVTGGTWYHDGRVDADAIAAARRRCLAQVRRLGAATAEMIHEGIKRDGRGAAYAGDKIAGILRTMVLDRSLEEVESTGEGEFAAVARGAMCFREPGKQQPGGMMEGIPCGVCPVIDECSPEGLISPSTCVYYKKWLQMDF